ncbi:unnamed protein product [Paramecium primaurelia]|uniref:Uncharacterized protein n=1 Tax=Paramecium primaurelia TaxID=5886 RepID=A0A8S1NG09_PARPR|nr:unnamed protein product [Paramecium primaurelia]
MIIILIYHQKRKEQLASKGPVNHLGLKMVKNIGSARVWLMHQNISWQALSRSIECCWGYIIDQQKNSYKQFFEQEYNPELIYYKLNQKFWFLVIASDGWRINYTQILLFLNE